MTGATSEPALASPTSLCAPWTLAQGLDPIGTAGHHAGYLLVDWPLPWPRDAGDIEDLAALRPALKAARCRLQVLVPSDPPTPPRVISYRRQAVGPFSGFERHEGQPQATGVVAAALELLQTPAPAPGGEHPGGQHPGGEHTVIVCTHGRRDRCCGGSGTRLALELLADPGLLGAGTRVARTSHTGGHRYAPTAIVFPEGTAWAFMDADLLARVVHRQGPVADVLPHYRGCAGVGGAEVQVVERAVLGEVGWGLWDLVRYGEELGEGRVRLHVEGLDGPGTLATWEARVGRGRSIPMPDCGGAIDHPGGTARELALHDFGRIA